MHESNSTDVLMTFLILTAYTFFDKFFKSKKKKKKN